MGASGIENTYPFRDTLIEMLEAENVEYKVLMRLLRRQL